MQKKHNIPAGGRDVCLIKQSMFNSIKFLLMLAIIAIHKKEWHVYMRGIHPFTGGWSFPMKGRTEREVREKVLQIGFPEEEIVSIQPH